MIWRLLRDIAKLMHVGKRQKNLYQDTVLLSKLPSGYWQQVPQVSIAQQYMKQMSKFCEQFGLTPASRSRIVTDRGNDSSDDAMEQLLSLGGEKK